MNRLNPSTQDPIIIIGAGMVGLTVANALAETNVPLIIIDAADAPSWPGKQYERRVSAITPASQKVFESFNVWQVIYGQRVSPYTDMHVWDGSGFGAVHFDSADVGAPYLGHIIENRVIIKALHDRLQAFSHINIIQPMRCEKVQFDAGNAMLTLADGRTFSASLIVGADGGRSWLRGQCDIDVHHWPYEQAAIVATVRTEKPHAMTAWERFLPKGPLALLPLDDPHYCSIVWSAESGYAQSLMDLSDDKFNKQITENFDARLGDISLSDERVMFPLHMQHAKQYIKPRMALVGDAAHTFHPLAGQGVNSGIADAMCLVRQIARAIEKQRDVGSLNTLRRYERARKGDNWAMIGVMEGFKRLFSNEDAGLRWLRNNGLWLCNRLPWLKRRFIRFAAGTQQVPTELPPLHSKGRGLG